MSITLHNQSKAVTAVRSASRHAAIFDQFIVDNAVTRENLSEYANALAVEAFPKSEPVQKKNGKRTVYGNAVQAAAWNLRAALSRAESDDDDNSEPVVNLLTRAGLKADLEDVIAAWKAAQDNN